MGPLQNLPHAHRPRHRRRVLSGGRYHITMPPQTLIDWPLM